MQTLQIDQQKAKKLYPTASKEFKEMLIDSFGEKFFSTDITDRITTLEDACIETGKDYNTIFDHAADEYEKAEIAIKIFAEAMREGKPAGECWYYPYFYRGSSGGGFSFLDFGGGDGCSGVGARLRVDTPKKATHMGRCMIEWYKKYING